MRYQDKEVQIISKKSVFGKNIAEIKVLSTGEIKSVPFADLSDEKKPSTNTEIAFKAVAAKIKTEIFQQSMLAPIESNIIPLPHQILALEKVMTGQFLRFLIADEVGMGKTIETGLILKELKLRGLVRRSLIIVPKSAIRQWQQEMKKHFNELFHIYDIDYINTVSRTFAHLEADNEINIFTQHKQILV